MKGPLTKGGAKDRCQVRFWRAGTKSKWTNGLMPWKATVSVPLLPRCTAASYNSGAKQGLVKHHASVIQNWNFSRGLVTAQEPLGEGRDATGWKRGKSTSNLSHPGAFHLPSLPDGRLVYFVHLHSLGPLPSLDESH